MILSFNNLLKFLRLLLIVIVLIKSDARPYAGNNRIAVTTTEFNNFRRILILLPDGVPSTGIKLSSDSFSGEFSITISPVDTGLYVSRRVHKETGKFPVRLQTSFPDSHTILITGKTTPFEKIVGYTVIGEGRLIFDIFQDYPRESFFGEKTISLFTQDQGYLPGSDFALSPGKPSLTAIQNGEVTTVSNGIKNRFARAFLFAGLIVLMSVGTFGIIIFTMNQYKMYKIKNSSSADTSNKTSGENTRLSIDSQIRELMNTRGISYDEASILINMSKKERINVEA